MSHVGEQMIEHVMDQVIFQVMHKLMYKLFPLIKLDRMLTY